MAGASVLGMLPGVVFGVLMLGTHAAAREQTPVSKEPPALHCAMSASSVPHLIQAAGGPVQVFVLPEPAPIPVGKFFKLSLLICERTAAGELRGWSAAQPRLQAVQAEMPAHRHGMNYTPSWRALEPVAAGGAGLTTTVQGLMFHMPGHWRLTLTFELPATHIGQAPQLLRISHDEQVR